MRASLGKGLADLIGEQSLGSAEELPLEVICPNRAQPRTIFDDDALDDLANSIKQVGVLQPIVVRPIAEGRYEIVAGERRYRAAARAGLVSLPVVIRPARKSESLILALIENLQREGISPVESAVAYQRLATEFGLTQEAIASQVGKARTSIANTMRLLKLPEEILSGLSEGRISEGHARALLGLRSPAAQVSAYRRILGRGLSVRETESLAQPQREPEPAKSRSSDPNIGALEDRLSECLGAPVRITGGRKAGTISIRFFNEGDLDRLVDLVAPNR